MGLAIPFGMATEPTSGQSTMYIFYTRKGANGIWRTSCKCVEASKALTEAKKIWNRGKGLKSIRLEGQGWGTRMQSSEMQSSEWFWHGRLVWFWYA